MSGFAENGEDGKSKPPIKPAQETNEVYMSTNRRDPSRGVSWGGSWQPPVQAPAPVVQSYSYLDSAGYCQLVLRKAQTAFGPRPDALHDHKARVITDFSAALGLTGGKKDDRLSRFDACELAALAEISRTPQERLRELGILKDSSS